MPRPSRKKNIENKSIPRNKPTIQSYISQKDLDRFEFHRHALALMPDAADEDPGVAVMIDGEGSWGEYFKTTSLRFGPAQESNSIRVIRGARPLTGSKYFETKVLVV